MSSIKLSKIKKDVQQINIAAWLKHWSNHQKVGLHTLSLQMGMNSTFLYSKCKKGDLLGSEMIIIGNYLDVNPFEAYAHLLNESCRPTKKERELEAQLLALQTKMLDLEKENAWLKEVVMGKK